LKISVERKKVRIQAGHGLMDKALDCGSALCGFIYQTVHPKGLGALEDCPKKLRSALLPQALPLTDRRKMA
jgi:hypothetical protein